MTYKRALLKLRACCIIKAPASVRFKRYGLPRGGDLLRVNQDFVAAFDTRTRNPRWVLEVINRDTLRGAGSRCIFRVWKKYSGIAISITQ